MRSETSPANSPTPSEVAERAISMLAVSERGSMDVHGRGREGDDAGRFPARATLFRRAVLGGIERESAQQVAAAQRNVRDRWDRQLLAVKGHGTVHDVDVHRNGRTVPCK